MNFVFFVGDEQSEFDETLIIVVGNKDDDKHDHYDIVNAVVNDKNKIRDEMKKHKANLRAILKYSNATPILRHIGIGYLCSYCAAHFIDPTDLKKHTLREHRDNFNPLTCHNKSKRIEYCMKLDITSLQCNLCDEEIDTLEELIEHLISYHDVDFYTDIKNQILPFKFNGEQLHCFICGREFEKFKILQEHMHVHYKNFVCEVCDAGYVNAGALSRHAEAHENGSYKCKYCPKVFNTERKKKAHERVVHVLTALYRCGYCFQMFKDYERKELHLSEMHGVKPIVYQCNACDRTFAMRKQLRMHIKREHLMDKRHRCDECDMRFFTITDLKRHSSKHAGVRHPCSVCLKTYASVRTLKTHMQLHMDERTLKCDHCTKSFSKKTGLKAHLRIVHRL